MPKILCAGTFDNFHVGHQFFLWSGYKICQNLTVIVARDTTVAKIKKRIPRNDELARLERVRSEFELFPSVSVRLGRSDGDFYQLIRDMAPDIIYLGYDQGFDVEAAQEVFPDVEFRRSEAFCPAFFKSSKF